MDESLVTSLEMSIKLRDAGFEQSNAHYYWHKKLGGQWGLLTAEQAARCKNLRWVQEFIAAFLCEEILRRLPGNLGLVGFEAYLQFTMLSGNRWMLQYMGRKEPPEQPTIVEPSLANAAAAMYCYLAKQKLLPPA